MSVETPYGVGKIIVLMPFGSHLYGTSTPSSDYDYKGVFLPTVESALTGRIPKRWRPCKVAKAEGEKNVPGDVDFELLSLHEFMRLLIEGQTLALDMLHAEAGSLIQTSSEWEDLYVERKRFYTKNLSAFVGYARRQAAKYGIKGSRLACAKWMVEECRKFEQLTVLEWVTQTPFIALDDIAEYVKIDLSDPDVLTVSVLDKGLTSGAAMGHYLKTFERYVESYGARARMAETNEGVDWKAMSHAVRAAYSVRTILSGETLRLPYPSHVRRELERIKAGKVPFGTVQKLLEREVEHIEQLAAKSTLPVIADVEWAMKFVGRCMLTPIISSVNPLIEAACLTV